MDDQGDLGEASAAVARLISSIGEDVTRGGLAETPLRYAKALRELTSGYGQKIEDVLKVFDDGGENYDEMVFQGAIPFYSLCEHHLLPFFGVAHIGYIPKNNRIVGLSKLARVTEIFARRLQVQERLTCQIAEALAVHLDPEGVGVVLRCRHLCIESRGVRKVGTITKTSKLIGALHDNASAKTEFLSMVENADAKATNI